MNLADCATEPIYYRAFDFNTLDKLNASMILCTYFSQRFYHPILFRKPVYQGPLSSAIFIGQLICGQWTRNLLNGLDMEDLLKRAFVFLPTSR
ncbi:hypothetical protein TNIN_480741 [Trichonephila inaurata madagascariensis]|uniref:Uncharacterized protein n=1 Tax=Trichonephila inaurata madagascariensis TaxID=2747483 RepID=A0A8X7BUH9_9ARAC|nr:hypothetical protein TNIN_480741 [Trichonephila inaurata madagascariensis]